MSMNRTDIKLVHIRTVSSLLINKYLYSVQLSGLTDGDKEALNLLIKAARVIDEIFYLQVM